MGEVGLDLWGVHWFHGYVCMFVVSCGLPAITDVWVISFSSRVSLTFLYVGESLSKWMGGWVKGAWRGVCLPLLPFALLYS